MLQSLPASRRRPSRYLILAFHSAAYAERDPDATPSRSALALWEHTRCVSVSAQASALSLENHFRSSASSATVMLLRAVPPVPAAAALPLLLLLLRTVAAWVRCCGLTTLKSAREAFSASAAPRVLASGAAERYKKAAARPRAAAQV